MMILRLSHRVAAARMVAATLGVAGAAWGLLTFPGAARHMAIERVASAIIAGDAFKPEALAALLARADPALAPPGCRPASLRSVAVARLALWEDALAAATMQSVDTRLEQLRDAIVQSLECSPADPFLWLVLFTVECSRTGFDPRYVVYLRLSYRLGPNEGWISMRRVRVAFSVFARLPADVAEAAMREFSALVANGFQQAAAGVLVGMSDPVRQALLARLAGVPERRRQEFAAALYQNGLYDITVPGIPPPGERPWR